MVVGLGELKCDRGPRQVCKALNFLRKSVTVLPLFGVDDSACDIRACVTAYAFCVLLSLVALSPLVAPRVSGHIFYVMSSPYYCCSSWSNRLDGLVALHALRADQIRIGRSIPVDHPTRSDL